MIPYGRQEVTDDDCAAVLEVLKSDYLTQGEVVPAFERAVADRVGASFGVACNSATSALHIACMALDLGPGDSLWTVPVSFVASANCALYCGATVDFVDVDENSGALCLASLESKLLQAENDRKLPKILVVVHLAGHPYNVAKLRALCEPRGVHIVEDASHAIGAERYSDAVGSCSDSVVTVFSFHPVKIVTSAEGGVATTNDEVLARRMGELRTHGVTKDNAHFSKPSHGPWYYEQQALGFNYRLSELHAALGVSQLSRLDNYVGRRAEIAGYYLQNLKGCTLVLPDEGTRSSWHLAIVLLPADRKSAKQSVFEKLRREGIGVNVHYIPIHTQPYYLGLGFKQGDYPNSESFYERAISLPLYPTMTDCDLDRCVTAVNSVL
ncbi:MAG: UDP-4-amino-4,6-dideoxy-N-acetyl-beta-L-altrosamine transaminase [Pseudomonadota bacterium]